MTTISSEVFETIDDERHLLAVEKLAEIRETRVEFALEYHRNTHLEKMDFEHYPHIREIYNSSAAVMVLMGSVQSMKSEFVIVDHFAAAYNGLSVFFVVPKFEARTTFVQNRINRCVENVPEYRKIMGAGFFDSVAIKNFGKGVIKYVGSNVISDFKEFPADVIIIDEIDDCNQENIKYALDRLRASKFQFKRYLGNPKSKDRGVHAYFMNSDQREWSVPCNECGEYNSLDWFKHVIDITEDREGNIIDYKLRDREFEIGCKRDIYLICEFCGNPLERASKEGKWIPKNPSNNIEGYHISMMCSPINSIFSMWEEFQKSIHNPSKLQQFYNSFLGLPYAAIGNKITEQLLDMCVDDDYTFIIKPDCAHIENDSHKGPCTMGVDVGGVFDVKISYLEERGVRRVVFIGKLHTIDELHELIERYNIEKCVFDSMPETTLVQDFQEDAECDVWLCRYRSEGTDRRKSYEGGDRVVNTDRTEVLDRTFAQLKQKKVILPVNYESILDGQFVAEMCTPIREVIEDDHGNSRFIWTAGKDHQRHADVYDFLAAGLLVESTIDEVFIG